MSKGKWVVDYGAINLPPNKIQHKEFDTEEEAIEWGKSQVGKTFTIEGWPQEMKISYLHMVYEPIWHNEGDVPIEDVFTTEEYDAPAGDTSMEKLADDSAEAAPA